MKRQPIPVFLQLVVAAILLIVPAMAGAQSTNLPLSVVNLVSDVSSAGRGNTNFAGEADANSGTVNPAKTLWVINNGEVPSMTMFGASFRSLNQGSMYTAAFSHADAKSENSYGLYASVRYIKSDSQAIGIVSGSNFRTLIPEFGFVQAFPGNPRLTFSFVARFVNISYTTQTFKDGHYQEDSPSALEGDVSFAYNGKDEDRNGFAFGVALKNFGLPMVFGFDGGQKTKVFLPIDIGGGASYTWTTAEKQQIDVLLDLHKSLAPNTPNDAAGYASYQSLSYGMFHPGSRYTAGIGVQLTRPFNDTIEKSLVFRLGGLLDSGIHSGYSGITAGIGLRLDKIRFDIAYGARNPYSSKMQFGTSYAF
ncbi:MAG: hypothetical protein V4478_01445 [Patescibacteria group bacterium]